MNAQRAPPSTPAQPAKEEEEREKRRSVLMTTPPAHTDEAQLMQLMLWMVSTYSPGLDKDTTGGVYSSSSSSTETGLVSSDEDEEVGWRA